MAPLGRQLKSSASGEVYRAPGRGGHADRPDRRRDGLRPVTIPKALRRLIRPSILELEPYEPVESVEAVAERTTRAIDSVIKLDANENPYGTSLRVQEVLAAFDRYHRYPDADQTAARQRVAEYAGAPAERIIIGNGSDELIDLLLLATIDPGDEVIVPTPTFGVYLSRPPLFGGVVRAVPRDDSFDLDVPAIEAAVTERTKIIFVASPNNPTGNLVSAQDLVRLLRTGALVVVDEAYFEFSGKTLLPLGAEFDNMVVLRTFSKWAGLAGLRVGYGIFPRALAQELWKVKQPFNVSAAGLKAIEAVLDDREYLMQTVARIRVERDRLRRTLRKLNFLQPYPSHGNYILCRVTRGDAHDIHRRLEARGILVRKYDAPDLRNYLRISVGRPEDTDALAAALRDMAEEI
ncbi:MAG: histidinol-phosphate transaminase [Thermomicrobiaceae bacterium]|nr:histidinol-phosphate transaminase [Thermomicrobiaceae bacterium]